PAAVAVDAQQYLAGIDEVVLMRAELPLRHAQLRVHWQHRGGPVQRGRGERSGGSQAAPLDVIEIPPVIPVGSEVQVALRAEGRMHQRTEVIRTDTAQVYQFFSFQAADAQLRVVPGHVRV